MRFTRREAWLRLKFWEGVSAEKYCGVERVVGVPEVKMKVGTEMGGMGRGRRGEVWILAEGAMVVMGYLGVEGVKG